MENAPFTVTFWGVRGTMPTPVSTNLQYGGHTSCVEIRCGQHRLIFDAGTGLYPLGEDATLRDMDIFLSHTHIDHIMGLPFFSPAYREEVRIRVWAGHLAEHGVSLREVFDRIMSPPIFPLRLDIFKSDLSFHEFDNRQPLDIPHLQRAGIEIQTMPLNHPDGATAYRVEFQGKSVCYVTDVEHLRDGLDAELIRFIKDADYFIYDSTFDDADFARFAGWGHSTWQEGMRLADAANVKRLVLFHHDPRSHDELLNARLNQLKQRRPDDIIAREGLTVSV